MSSGPRPRRVIDETARSGPGIASEGSKIICTGSAARESSFVGAVCEADDDDHRAATFRYGQVEEAQPAEPCVEVQVAQEPRPPPCEAYAAMWFGPAADIWVIGSDPSWHRSAREDAHHPRAAVSAAKRLMVFAEIQT